MKKIQDLSHEAEMIEQEVEATYKEIHKLNNIVRAGYLAEARIKELNRKLNHLQLGYSDTMDKLKEMQLERLASTAPMGVVFLKGTIGGMKG